MVVEIEPWEELSAGGHATQRTSQGGDTAVIGGTNVLFMARHLITSAIVLVLAFVPMLWVCRKFPNGKNTLRNFAIGGAAVFVSVVVASLLANVTVRPCRRDPTRVCEYNDMVPFIATIVIGYLLVSIVKSWWLYIER